MGRTIQPVTVTEEYQLPDILQSGTLLQTKTLVARVIRTSQRDPYDQPYVRLSYPEHTHDGWWFPAISGNTLYTRDDLQAMGCKILKKSRRTT